MTFGSSENERKLYSKNLIGKSILIWLILIAAKIIHGISRAMALVPLVGEFRSNEQHHDRCSTAMLSLRGWLAGPD